MAQRPDAMARYNKGLNSKSRGLKAFAFGHWQADAEEIPGIFLYSNTAYNIISKIHAIRQLQHISWLGKGIGGLGYHIQVSCFGFLLGKWLQNKGEGLGLCHQWNPLSGLSYSLLLAELPSTGLLCRIKSLLLWLKHNVLLFLSPSNPLNLLLICMDSRDALGSMACHALTGLTRAK